MVFVIAILGTIAVSSYINSTTTFKFLSGYKQMRSSLDIARSYAITNRMTGEEVPDRYGVCVSADSVVLFADVGELPMLFDYDSAEHEDLGGCVSTAEEGADDHDVVLSSYVFEDYAMGAFDFEEDISTPADNLLSDSGFVLVFYGYDGTASVVVNDEPLPDDRTDFFLTFYQDDGERFKKTLKIHLLTGLIDEI